MLLPQRHSIIDLYENEDGRRRRQHAALLAQQQVCSECTFQPQIDARSRRLSLSLGARRSSTSLPDTAAEQAMQAAALRRQKLVEQRSMQEYEELKDCTFTPEINKAILAPKACTRTPSMLLTARSANASWQCPSPCQPPCSHD